MQASDNYPLVEKIETLIIMSNYLGEYKKIYKS